MAGRYILHAPVAQLGEAVRPNARTRSRARARSSASPGRSWKRIQKFRHGWQVKYILHAPVAQLDRVPGYELGGREFESLRARQISKIL